MIGLRFRDVGVGLFCLFCATFVCFEDLFGLEPDCNGFWGVNVDVLRLHDGDIGLGGDLRVGGHLAHV